MIRNIHHFGFHVRNFDGMVDFYKEAFGFEVVGDELSFGEGPTRVAMICSGNCFLEIIGQPSSAHPSASPVLSSYPHLCVEVTDIEQEYRRLEAMGVDFEGTAPADFGYAKTVKGRDPEGNLFEMMQTVDQYELGHLPSLTR